MLYNQFSFSNRLQNKITKGNFLLRLTKINKQKLVSIVNDWIGIPMNYPLYCTPQDISVIHYVYFKENFFSLHVLRM